MEMMVQGCLPNGYSVDATTSSPTTDKGFKALLKFAQESLSEDLPETKEEDIDVLLAELLNLLNIPIEFQDIIFVEDLENPEIKLMDILQGLKLETQGENALFPMFQELFTEFEDTGHIKLADADKFYQALIDEFPEVEEIDADGFKASLEQIFVAQCDSDIIKGDKLQIAEEKLQNAEKDSEMFNVRPPEMNMDEESSSSNIKEQPLRATPANSKVKTQSAVNEPVKVHSEGEIGSSYGSPMLPEDVSILKEDILIQPADISKLDHAIEPQVSESESAVFDQIVDKMKFLVVGENKQISIQLKPEHLGQILVKVFEEKDRMRAEFFVSNTQVKEMLNIHAQDFKNEIQEQGYNFSDISVYDLSEGLENGSFSQFQGDSSNNPFKKNRFTFKGPKGSLSEISAEKYYDPWREMSNVDFKA